jgi:hypothetical protein
MKQSFMPYDEDELQALIITAMLKVLESLSITDSKLTEKFKILSDFKIMPVIIFHPYLHDFQDEGEILPVGCHVQIGK